ncbi:unnamed protein product [Ceutorhynchus assimilis]|uniref:Nascent polypeptide-associated complex subunit beta n=1 Tax=Ceutorhynchus assimilis TaxID=467358 RepID=A0A9P0GJC5_9CUCU|nr:unnamed protein product [Ceutorhynchus assimilis]
MNVEKLKKMEGEVRIGGKGTPRRKKKYVRSNQANSAQANNNQIFLTTLRSLGIHNCDHVEFVFEEDDERVPDLRAHAGFHVPPGPIVPDMFDETSKTEIPKTDKAKQPESQTQVPSTHGKVQETWV